MPRNPTLSFQTELLLNSLYIAASGSATTTPFSISGFEGYLSVFFQLTGSGTATLIYELSHDNVNWSQVTTLSTLVTGFVVTSGPASDGKNFIYFNPPVAAWLRFKVTETGTANPIYVTLSIGAI